MSQMQNSGKAQCRNLAHFSHGTNHSNVVLNFLHKFKGDIYESMSSSDVDGLGKQDNALFIICNIYDLNSQASNNILSDLVILKLKDLNSKWCQGAFCILCGDFIE